MALTVPQFIQLGQKVGQAGADYVRWMQEQKRIADAAKAAAEQQQYNRGQDAIKNRRADSNLDIADRGMRVEEAREKRLAGASRLKPSPQLAAFGSRMGHLGPGFVAKGKAAHPGDPAAQNRWAFMDEPYQHAGQMTPGDQGPVMPGQTRAKLLAQRLEALEAEKLKRRLEAEVEASLQKSKNAAYAQSGARLREKGMEAKMQALHAWRKEHPGEAPPDDIRDAQRYGSRGMVPKVNTAQTMSDRMRVAAVRQVQIWQKKLLDPEFQFQLSDSPQMIENLFTNTETALGRQLSPQERRQMIEESGMDPRTTQDVVNYLDEAYGTQTPYR